MRTSVSVVANEASEVVASSCNNGVGKADTIVPLSSVAGSCKWFPGLAKFLSPIKPAATIHFLTKEPERTCYEWVRGKFDPPSRILIRLLHTDQGWRVLEYLMRGCKEKWWLEVQCARIASRAYDAAVEQLSLLD